jgi:hypothetical protein
MFKITERQYHIILKQAQDSYPYEAGGILGGREDTILGVLPIANKAYDKGTVTFGLTSDDLERAYQFLVKHKLNTWGSTTLTPRGSPIRPSRTSPTSKNISSLSACRTATIRNSTPGG